MHDHQKSAALPLAALAFVLAFAAQPSVARAQQKQPAPRQQVAEQDQRRTADVLARYTADLGQAMSLSELLSFAQSHAPLIQRARKRVALGQASIAGAQKFQQFNPEIEGTLAAGLDDPGINRYEVGLKQRLEVFGQRGLRLEAARRQKRALVAELEQGQWDVHQQVHRLYRVGLVGQQRVGIERETLEFTQQLLEVAQQRYDAGEEPQTSVVVARAEIARARQRLVQVWTGYRRTLGDLGATVGWAQDAVPRPAGQPSRARRAPAAEQLLAKAYDKDPRLAVLRAQLDQAQADLAFEQRKAWPDPVVGLGFEREKLSENEFENSLLVSLGVPLPLWDRNQGGIAAAKARVGIYRQAIENRKAVLSNRVRKQADSVQSAYTQAQIYQQEVLPALRTQLDMLHKGFKLGEMSLLDVMNARDRLLAVQREYLDALQEYYVAVSDLEKLLGAPIWKSE